MVGQYNSTVKVDGKGVPDPMGLAKEPEIGKGGKVFKEILGKVGLGIVRGAFWVQV